MIEKESNFYLYKIIDKDRLVYVGKSTNIDKRLDNHSVINTHFYQNACFFCRGRILNELIIYVANVPDEYLLSIYEITLISKYKPIYNNESKYSTNNLFKLPKLNWFPYVSKENCNASYIMRTRNIPDKDSLDTPLKRWNLLKQINSKLKVGEKTI